LRMLVSAILVRSGYSVLAAASGGEALDVWRKHRGQIDLLLTDIMMPEGMTGRELAEKILADDPEMKVLFTSGYPMEVVGSELSKGGHNFLQKPYQPAALGRAVRQCLDAGRKRQTEPAVK
jgi:two-component system, cell cycle sensor histidine kinase and response regulator CckA